jgi:hypothetical protein
VFTAGGQRAVRPVSAPTYSPQTSDDVVVHEGQEAEFSQLIADWLPAIAAQIPAGTVLDGELVVHRDGRCDLASLQHRTCAHPRDVPSSSGGTTPGGAAL